MGSIDGNVCCLFQGLFAEYGDSCFVLPEVIVANTVCQDFRSVLSKGFMNNCMELATVVLPSFSFAKAYCYFRFYIEIEYPEISRFRDLYGGPYLLQHVEGFSCFPNPNFAVFGLFRCSSKCSLFLFFSCSINVTISIYHWFFLIILFS